jgi:hypothetical protein
MLGWHFLNNDRRLGYGDGRLVEAGQTYSCEGKLVLCSNGMHGSRKLIDALQFAPGNVLCRIDLQGEIIHDDNKSVARYRKVLWIKDIEHILHEFACREAEDALAIIKNPDQRSIDTIQAKRDWLKGKITDDELKAVYSNASSAAYTAIYSVASAVASSTAYYAASAVTSAVASAAAYHAVSSAAYIAIKAKQNKRLTAMVLDI